MKHLFFVFWITSLFSTSPDFDVVVVGTSPFSLLEALYRFHLGDRVLILERSSQWGGAWQSLDVCGIPNADLGCHQIGHDPELRHFLEKWVGCKMVSLDSPESQMGNGYYFSEGSFELIDHLKKLIEKTEIVSLFNHRLESVNIDPFQPMATVNTNLKQFTTSKIVVPIYSDIKIENHPFIPLSSQQGALSQFQHLYLLIEDPEPSRFTYYGSVGPEISRMMNLTNFVHLSNTGKQLIVFQYYGEETAETAHRFISYLQSQQFLSPTARLISVESHTYEQSYCNQELIEQTPNASALFDVLQTGHITNLSQYLSKWKVVLKPYNEALGENLEH